MSVNHTLVANFNVVNMPFNAIRENKTLAKISEFTVHKWEKRSAVAQWSSRKGAQLLSGRVLDSKPRGRGFEPHRRHCAVSLSKTHLS